MYLSYSHMHVNR